MIVIGVDVGRRGRDALKSLVPGSLSAYVLQHSTCPVLVVQAQHSDSEAAAPSIGVRLQPHP